MDINKALVAFYALSQETRLRVFKILVEYGSSGAAAGVISDRLKIPHNTLSFHLSNLSQAGLVSSSKKGRSIIYSANTKAIEGLISYLSENCCVLETSPSTECCPPNKTQKRKKS
jgi:ArsR family transcriptional regulator